MNLSGHGTSCHGGRGQIRQAYREGQEDKLAALGLVLNAVVLCNTRDPDAAVARLRAEGHDIKDEDVARLSPLKDRHIDFLGRYLFNIRASGPGRYLRPLRGPDAPELDEDDEALDRPGLSQAARVSSAVADPLRLALISNLRHTVASRSGQSALW